MSDRSWSPPLDVDTRTLKSVSIIRARPEHLPSIHKIQLLAYPGRFDFHETEEVFRSKLEAYPAGNFVALATYSVVTHDDTSTWDGKNAGEEEEEEESEFVHGISVVEITETGPDGASTTTTTTTTLGNDGNETQSHHVDIVRARTPDISEGTDDEDDVSSHKWSTGLDVPHAAARHGHRQDSKAGEHHHTATSSDASATTARAAAAAGPEEDDEEDTTILFQWEEPVGYLFSHPYSRESVTLHRMGAGLAHEGKAAAESTDASSKPKRIRLDGGGGGSGAEASSKEHHDEEEEEEEEGENDTMFDHDQWMEKYYVHDCAIHPGWRGQGLASKLWKALEESLTPARDSEVHGGVDGAASGASGDLVDTEEEEEDNEGHDESAPEDDKTTSTSTTRRRRGRRGSKKSHGGSHKHGGRSRRKGAPNLKEIVLVSVQGTKPFWQRAGGFQVVTDHDMDLSVYGDEAFLMHKAFVF